MFDLLGQVTSSMFGGPSSAPASTASPNAGPNPTPSPTSAPTSPPATGPAAATPGDGDGGGWLSALTGGLDDAMDSIAGVIDQAGAAYEAFVATPEGQQALAAVAAAREAAKAAQAAAQQEAGKLVDMSFPTWDAIDHEFAGKTEAEVLSIRTEYDRANGEGTFDERFGTDHRRWERQATVDQEAASQAATELFNAMDGIGTNETAITSALRGKSADEIAEIRRIYAETYPGRSLDADLDDELDGDYLAETQALMSGDVVTAAVVGLENAMWGIGTDDKAVEDILRGLPVDKRSEVLATYKDRYGIELKTVLEDDFSGSDEDAMLALADGDAAKADAIQIDDAMSGWFLGIGVDSERVHDILDNTSDPAALDRAYTELQGDKWLGGPSTLAEGLSGSLSAGAELDVATALIDIKSGDEAKVAAAKIALAAGRIQLSADQIGTDETTLWAQLEGKSQEERDAIIARFNEQYGAGWIEDGGDPSSAFATMLDEEFDGLDQQKSEQLAADGKLDPAFALHYATSGIGTDEKLIKDTLRGMSGDDIDVVRKQFAAVGRDLDAELSEAGGELSGRDAFEVQQLLLGEPKTLEDKLARAKAAYEWERGSGNGFVDAFSDSGEALDAKYQQILELEDSLAAAKASGDPAQIEVAEFALERHLGYIGGTQSSYQAAKDRIADTAANVATAAGGVALTIASGGLGAGAMLAGVLGAAGGGALGMATKAGIEGDAYGWEEAGLDVGNTLVSMASAGVAQASSLGKLATSGAASLGGGKLVEEGIKGVGSGLVSGIGSGLLDENCYGEGGLGNFLATVGTTVLGSAVGNAATAGVAAKLPATSATMNPVLLKSLTGAAGGVVGGVAETMVQPGVFEGEWGMTMLLKSGLGALSNAAQGAAEGFGDLRAIEAATLAEANAAALRPPSAAEAQAGLDAINAELGPGPKPAHITPEDAAPFFADYSHVDMEAAMSSDTVRYLREQGASEAQILQYVGSLGKDQQSLLHGKLAELDAMPADQREHAFKHPEQMSKARYEEMKKLMAQGSDKDAFGNTREAMPPEQAMAVVATNALLFEKTRPGTDLRKVIPDADVHKYVAGNEQRYKGFGGDVALAEYTHDMTGPEKAQYLGLDYEQKPNVAGAKKSEKYTKLNADGEVVLAPDVEQHGVVHIDQKVTQAQHDNLAVQVGSDIMANAALARHALEGLAAMFGQTWEMPELLQGKANLDADGHIDTYDFDHLTLRDREHAHDPSEGKGFTASQGLRDDNGRQFFTPNQEMTHKDGRNKPTPFQEGTTIQQSRPDSKTPVTVATFVNGQWIVDPSVPDDERAHLGLPPRAPTPAAP